MIGTVLLDFDIMTLTVIKKHFRRLQPRIINFGSYQDLYNEEFWKDLKRKVASQIFVNKDVSFQRFCDFNVETLNKHAPLKKRYI